ncbi:MAG TPA: ribosome small subunit-dependent GTPase A [Armatimonadota bacterium]|nr:ribosome small subunit-dependent GTPase A [Armatimonadota bacterium]
MNLTHLGWSEVFAQHFAPYREEAFLAARVTLEQKNQYVVATETYGEIPAFVTGKFLYDTLTRDDFPVVGDWVAIRTIGQDDPQATIHAVLPRVSKFSRTSVGNGGEQPIAANIYLAFLATGLDGNFNVRRIERYLLQTRKSQVQPVILLTKADVCPDIDARLQEVRQVAGNAPVYAVSTLAGSGLAEVTAYLQPGVTVALIGSSGVGKSTLLNYLLGSEVMRTQEVRADDSRGRHTTSFRQLFLLPSGAALIDTPGMRELQLWGDTDGLLNTFPEIEALSRRCRFADCRHGEEPGCAVQAALESGELEADRFASYQKLQREQQFIAAKTDRQEEQAIKRKWKQIHKLQKEIKKQRGR